MLWLGVRVDLAHGVFKRVHRDGIGGLCRSRTDLIGAAVDGLRQVLGGVGDIAEVDVAVGIVGARSNHHGATHHLEGELAVDEVVVLQGLRALNRGIALRTHGRRISLVAVLERNGRALVGGLRTVHHGLHRHGAITVIGRGNLDRVGVGIQHIVLVVAIAGRAVLRDGVCVGHTVVGLVELDGLERVVLHRGGHAGGSLGAFDRGGRTVLDAELLSRRFVIRSDGEAELTIRHSMVRHLLGDVQTASAIDVVLSGGLVRVRERAGYGCSGHELTSHVLYLNSDVDRVGVVRNAAVVALNLRHCVLVRTGLVI